MYIFFGQHYFLERRINEVINMPSALETKMRVTLSCTEQANKPDKDLSFAELRKKIAKPSPFGKKLVDIYKQGR
ncbi:hypothetical protein EPB69_16180 [Geobacillus stearothermophilus]|nr:hypothetical protein EPB69_16180 [Geobacillus stearothermophilus]